MTLIDLPVASTVGIPDGTITVFEVRSMRRRRWWQRRPRVQRERFRGMVVGPGQILGERL